MIHGGWKRIGRRHASNGTRGGCGNASSMSIRHRWVSRRCAATSPRLHGLSDREAVEAFEFDARWKYACGGLDFDHPGFVHTVLVDMRARLARSDRPRRIFEVSLGRGTAGRDRVGPSGCWIRHRSMTRWPPRTP